MTGGQTFSNINDHALDQIVRGILQTTPKNGYWHVQGALQRHGLQIQLGRIIEWTQWTQL